MVFSLTACSKDPAPSEENGIKETQYDFIVNSASDYKIVMPAAPDEDEEFAAEELVYFLNEATGITFPVISDAGLAYDPAAHYISVGDTAISEAAGVKAEHAQLLDNGYVIKTVGQSVFILGSTGRGTMNGVYEFLEHTVDYKFFAVDEFYVESVTDAKLLDFNISYKPSFNWREGTYGEIIRNDTLLRRHRFNPTADIYVFGHDCHNSFDVISPTVYKDKTEWFNTDKTQLCYSNEEMIVQYIENIKPIIRNSDASILLMGQEDTPDWCTCAECAAENLKYGTDAAVLIRFANTVAEAVTAWMEEELPDRAPMTFIIFGYYTTNKPPVVTAEDGSFVPIDDTVVCNDNVGVMYAPIGADFSSVTFDDNENQYFYDNMRGWSAVTDTIHMWAYPVYTTSFMVCHDSYSVMQDNYKTYIECNAVSLLDQTEHGQLLSTGFSRVAAYLQAQLQWNVDQDINELLDEFFAHYFRDAAPSMRRYFDEMRLWYVHLYEDENVSGQCGYTINEAQFWPQNLLLGWQECIDEAYAAIAKYETSDPELYAKLYDRISLEEISVRYLLIEHYSGLYGTMELDSMKEEFYSEWYRLGLTTDSESGNINDLWTDWFRA